MCIVRLYENDRQEIMCKSQELALMYKSLYILSATTLNDINNMYFVIG